jgi:hypothetical protein
MEQDHDPFEYRARKAHYVESEATTEPSNLELAVFIRRVALILDPQHYGEERKKLRLAAQRLEATELCASSPVLPHTSSAITEAKLDDAYGAYLRSFGSGGDHRSALRAALDAARKV